MKDTTRCVSSEPTHVIDGSGIRVGVCRFCVSRRRPGEFGVFWRGFNAAKGGKGIFYWRIYIVKVARHGCQQVSEASE